MWYGPLGFLIAVVAGWTSSWIARLIFKENLTEVDAALLSPIVANRARERRGRVDEFRNTIAFDERTKHTESVSSEYM